MTVGFQPFVLREQYIRVDCDLKDANGNLVYEGLWIECRKNLTNGEREILIQLNDEIAEELDGITKRYSAAAKEIDAERATLAADDREGRERLETATTALIKAQTAEYKAILPKRQALVVPHVRAWNLYTLDENDTPTPVPPPKEGGIEVLKETNADLTGWMLTTLLTAYRSGFGIGSAKSGGSPEPTNVPATSKPAATALRSTRRSPKK